MAGIRKKAMRGAAQAGAAASIEAMKAEITRKRDERLQSFQQGMQQQQWERDDVTRAEDRQERERSELRGITERSQNRLLDQQNQERQFGIAEQGLEMDRERLDLTAQQIDQALRQGEFGLIEAQRLRGIQDVIVNPDSDPDEVSTAIQMLRNLKGGDPEKYQFLRVSSGDYEPDRIFRANTTTGEGDFMELPGGTNQYSTPEDVRSALRAGEITREEATLILQSRF